MAVEVRDSDWHSRLRRNLRRWYERHARDLPWRRTTDPYRVWISEIMLQQTTVVAVVPYYERFLDRFPTIDDLAIADEQVVLRLWEGLGYYSRARNLHQTARRIVDQHGGRFPRDAADLGSLPGIGRYTAGAIASFAFDQPAPIVEANTLRLYCRLLGYDGDPRSREGQQLLWSFAAEIVPKVRPGRFNQALMELGARVCRPGDPDCGICPVRSCCNAFNSGRQQAIPRPKTRPKITHLTEAGIAVRKRGRILMRQRPPGELWAGLWDFPRFEIGRLEPDESLPDEPTTEAPCIDAALHRRLSDSVAAQTGIEAEIGESIAEIHHSVTRYRIRLLCFDGRFVSGRLSGTASLRWVRPANLDELPLSVTGRKLARVLIGRESAAS